MTSNNISLWVAGLGNWPLIGALILNLLFRKYGRESRSKRLACLFHAITLFAISVVAHLVTRMEWSDLYFFALLGLIAAVLFLYRARVFPYRLQCADCSNRLSWQAIYFKDDNLCSTCRSKPKEDA